MENLNRNAAALPPAQLFDLESQRALDNMMSEATDVLRRLDVSDELMAHVHKRRGWTRKLYPTSGWIRDPELRLLVGTATSMHCLGITLLDDVIDADTALSNRELMAGTEVCVRAYELMARKDVLPLFLADYTDEWLPIWKHVMKEPITDIFDLGAWERTAAIKAGDIIAFYARFSLAVAGREQEFRILQQVFRAMGVIFTVLNDYLARDRPTEAHSNLFALMQTGRIDRTDVIAMMDDHFDKFERALASVPPEFDFSEPLTGTYHRFRDMLVDGNFVETPKP